MSPNPRNRRPGPLLTGVAAFAVWAAGLGTSAALASDYPPAPVPPPPPPGLAEAYYSTCGGSHPPVQYVVSNLKPGDKGYDELMNYARSPEYRRYLNELVEYKKEYGSDPGTYDEVDPRTGSDLNSASDTKDGRSVTDDERKAKRERLKERKEKDESSGAREPEGPVNSTPYQQETTDETASADPDGSMNAPAGNPTGIAASAPKRFAGFQTDGGNVIRGPKTGLAGGPNAQKVERDPKQDLAQWLRGFLYHEAVNPVTYAGEPETAVSLEHPDAGPEPSSSHYGMLVKMMELDDQAAAPSPKEVLDGLYGFWQTRWRRTLGFESDPSSKNLIADLEQASKAAAAAQKRVTELKRRVESDADARGRLQQQVAAAERELKSAQAAEKERVDRLFRRLDFVRTVSALFRLAPEGGFGPSFEEVSHEELQSQAGRILTDIGALAGNVTWKGLASDLLWIDRYSRSGESQSSDALRRRVAATNAAEKLLKDRRLDGLTAVCDFLASGQPADAVVMRKAFELVDFLGTKMLNAEVLRALPALLQIAKGPDEAVAKRARLLVLRVLGIREGRASLEEPLLVLAPLVKDPDAELARATVDFLQRFTGQSFGADAKAWLKLQAQMASERRKLSNPDR